MAKIGRNDTCPCGSGKKYKRCCLGAPVAMELAATTANAPTEAHPELCPCCVDELNERADHVVDELLAGHVDEAEALCHDFLRDFPGEAEGIDLLSMIASSRRCVWPPSPGLFSLQAAGTSAGSRAPRRAPSHTRSRTTTPRRAR